MKMIKIVQNQKIQQICKNSKLMNKLNFNRANKTKTKYIMEK